MIKKIATAILFLGLSLLVGRWVAIPLMNFLFQFQILSWIVSGSVLCAVGYVAYKVYITRMVNYYVQYISPVVLPATKNELTEIGIRTPVDFCFYMDSVFRCVRVKTFGSAVLEISSSQNEDAWKAANELFRENFGHNLGGYDADSVYLWNWVECAFYEADRLLGKGNDEMVSSEEVWNLLSPGIITKLNLCKEDFV